MIDAPETLWAYIEDGEHEGVFVEYLGADPLPTADGNTDGQHEYIRADLHEARIRKLEGERSARDKQVREDALREAAEIAKRYDEASGCMDCNDTANIVREILALIEKDKTDE